MKILFILLALLSWCTSIYAQDSFDMERYLATALGDQSLERYQSQLSFLENNNYNTPWINRLELRVGSEDANASLNQYRLRVSPSNPSEIKANKKYHEQQIKTLNTEHKIALNEALVNRYKLLIDLIHLLKKQKLLQERIDFHNTLTQSIHKGGNQNLNLKDLISLQSDQSKYLLKHEEIETLITYDLYYINLDYGDANLSETFTQDLISIDQIKGYIKMASEQTESQSLVAEEIENKLELNRQELKIEKAESRSNIGYIQSNIDTDRGNELNEHIGFQVGLRIPIVNPDKPNLNRKKVDLIEEEEESKSKLSLINETQKLKGLLLQRLLDRYQIVTDRIELAETITISNTNQVDWNQIADLKNYKLELYNEKIDTEKLIQDAYIDFLDTRGLLIGTPLLNYLSKNFTPIETLY